MNALLKEKIKNFFSKKNLKDWLYLTVGVAISSFAFSFFLNPYNIVIGGVSGVGVILKSINESDPATVILIINICLILIGLLTIGKDFFVKTTYGAVMFSVFIWVFDFVLSKIDFALNAQTDMALIILFSSIIMGIGLGIVVKYGGSTGGTEIPQRILFKHVHMPFSLSLYLIDGSVIIAGYFLTNQNLSIILYEIVFVYLCGVVMDTVIFSGFNKRAVYIISDKVELIKEQLLTEFSRGVTSIKVIGEYSKNERKMLLCVLSSLEYYKLRDDIEKIDKYAFFYVVRASEVRGEGFSYESRPFDN